MIIWSKLRVAAAAKHSKENNSCFECSDCSSKIERDSVQSRHGAFGASGFVPLGLAMLSSLVNVQQGLESASSKRLVSRQPCHTIPHFGDFGSPWPVLYSLRISWDDR